MPQIVHHFVDPDGKTHVDEFSSGIPLDMGDVPSEYHVVFATRHNSALAADLYKQLNDGKHTRFLMTACPASGDPVYGFKKFDDAKLLVRQLCFENPHPIHGGIRRARPVDYTNVRIVSLYQRAQQAIMRETGALKSHSPADVIKAIKAGYVEAFSNPGEIVATVSAHPLWKRLSWIFGLDPVVALHIIGDLVDPTWYVNTADPRRSGLFKERCGIYSAEDATAGTHISGPVWRILSAPMAKMIQLKGIKASSLNAPKFFFCRYALRWMQLYLDDGAEAAEALFLANWRHNVKLANFIWLNWMEVMHESPPQHFDEARFFLGDKSAAEESYRAALS
jgi:hypothetical protein